MKTTILIENLKCHGCANTIRRNLMSRKEVSEVRISHEDSSVEISFEGEEAELRTVYVMMLKKLGYPEKGTNTSGATVKSYVSCVIGRINRTTDLNRD